MPMRKRQLSLEHWQLCSFFRICNMSLFIVWFFTFTCVGRAHPRVHACYVYGFSCWVEPGPGKDDRRSVRRPAKKPGMLEAREENGNVFVRGRRDPIGDE